MPQEEIDAIILAFLEEYKAWAEADAPEDGIFDNSHGLCNNLSIYLRHQVGDEGKRDSVKKYFKPLLGGKTYPFSSQDQYEYDTDNYSHHRNQARMEWVNDHIERLEKLDN